jgi:hypothetical protein
MKGLMLHRGGQIVTENQLRSIKAPDPSGRWYPISHGELLDIVTKVGDEIGLTFGNSEFGVQSEGQKMFGVLEVENQDHMDGQLRLMMGLRNSMDRSFSAAMCFGSKVFVCDNMAFSGEERIARRHTINILNELPQLVNEKLSTYSKYMELQENTYRKLQKVEVTDTEAESIILKAATDFDIIPLKDSKHVLHEWRGVFIEHRKLGRIIPENENYGKAQRFQRHEEFAPKTSWSLFNHFTEVMKATQKKNSLEAAERTMRLTGMFKAMFCN